MQTNYEPIILALFNHLKANVSGVNTFGRRLVMWGECQDQPALFLRHISDTDEWPALQIERTRISLEIWLYSKAGKNPDVAPDSGLNPLIAAVRAAFVPDSPYGTFTIGGMVQYARIEGKSEYDPGDLDGQAKAVIPVEIMLP